MKLAIIGAGNIVHAFLPQILAAPGITIIAIQGTPRSIEKTRALCAQYAIPHALQSFDEVEALRPDAVYIATPNHLHYPYARRALEAGIHAIVEKPLTVNLAQAEALAALARQKGVCLYEAITTPHMGNYRQLQSWLPRLGAPQLIRCDFSQYSRRYDAWLAGQTLPVFDPAQCGGALMDLGVYTVHFAVGLFGAPQSVRYTANIEKGIDFSGTLVLRWPGRLATLTFAKNCAGPVCCLVQGTAGWMSAAQTPNHVGAVALTLRDGTAETFDDGLTDSRCTVEFAAITRAIAARDTAFYEACLAQSLAVMRVLTEARADAGLRFPAGEGL